MPMQINGLALKSFYDDAHVWSGQDGKPLYWIDDIRLLVNELEIVEDSSIQLLHDDDQVQILTGNIYSYEDLGEVATLEEYFKGWQQNRQPAPHDTGRQPSLEFQAPCSIMPDAEGSQSS